MNIVCNVSVSIIWKFGRTSFSFRNSYLECIICYMKSFDSLALLIKLFRLLAWSFNSCNVTENLGSESINFEVKSSGGTASGKFICSWLAKAMLIVKYMFLSTLSAEGHEAKELSKNTLPPCN